MRKVDQENKEKFGKLGKLGNLIRRNNRMLGKFGVRPKKRKKRSSLNFGWEIRKIGPNQESSFGRLGKLIRKIRQIRKLHSENQETSFGRLGKLGKFIRKISPQYQENPPPNQENSSSILGKFRLKKPVPGGKNTFCNYDNVIRPAFYKENRFKEPLHS